MMGAKVHLMLTALVAVNLVPSERGQPMILSDSDQETKRSAGPPLVHSGVQKNFQSLIESVAKSDLRGGEIHRKALKENVANGQQVFDTIKDEVRTMQRRNLDRRRDHGKSEMRHSGNVSPVKRETEVQVTLSEDDKYVAMYGNHFFFAGIWEVYRKLHEDEPRMRYVCAQAHAYAGKVPGAVNCTAPAIRELHFHDPEKYHHIRFDILTYTIWNHSDSTGMPVNFYLTKGLSQDCVYYVKPIDPEEETLMLDQHICGIII